MSGIVFPYLDPITGNRTTARLRRDNPEIDASGKPKAKYISPYGDTRHLYMLPAAGPLLSEVSAAAVIVESEKSVLALTALASRAKRTLLPIGTGGCWGWRGKTGIQLDAEGERNPVSGALPDFDRIAWAGRAIVVALDSNARTSPHVRATRRALTEQLEARGASVKIAELPQLADVNGPDDLIAIAGDQAMLALLDSAQPFAETALREAEAGIAALEADKTQDPLPVLADVAAVADSMRRQLLKAKIAGLKVPGLDKRTVDQAVEAHQRTARKNSAIVTEMVQQERLLRLDVEPARLIDSLEHFYSDRRFLPPDAAFIEALFCINTYTFDVFDTVPYLLYYSATGGCGKTTSLERHELVCARAYLGVDPTAAVVYRKIDRDRPTWLLDEARVLQIHGDQGQELLAIFDAGYKRGAVVSRCDDHGNDIRDFKVFCPKALARIGSFRGTLLDRGITVHLEKARLRQKRRAVLAKGATALKEKLEAYASQYRARLEDLYRGEPDEGYWPAISGREEEIWSPLLMHARLAGTEIEKRALEVARRYSRQKGELALDADRTLALAREVLEVLQPLTMDVFKPSEILAALREKENWGADLEERKSDKARATVIGSFLANFRVASRAHTTNGSEYGRLDMIAALKRHMPDALTAEDGAAASTEAPPIPEPPYCVTQWSDPEVSSSQPIVSEELTCAADTLTPETGGQALVEEEL
jgi:hypothetical protein